MTSVHTVYAAPTPITIETGCGTTPSYNGTLQLNAGEYDVYVRLAKRGEQATVRSYVQLPGQTGNCQLLGNTVIQASGDRWVKAGEFSAFRQQDYIFQLSSTYLQSLPSANRPAIMVIPKRNPICIPAEKCEVTLNGEVGFVVPPGTLLNHNSLHVSLLVDPSTDRVATVNYYVDDKLMYRTSTIEAFDVRYISYPQQKLTRVIEYASGQRVVIESQAPTTHGDSFSNFLFRLYQRYPSLVLTLIWLIAAAAIAGCTILLLRQLVHRHNQRIHYGFVSDRPSKYDRAIQHIQNWKILRIAKVIVVCGLMGTIIIVLIFTINRYVAQITTVDGKSMQKTYSTGDQILVNKIPKTINDLNGREFIPQRGEIVTVRNVFGITAIPLDNENDIQLIKRVIGLPGERVVVENGVLTIFNRANPNGFQPDKGSSWEQNMTPSDVTEMLDVQLSSSEIFVTGDNRPESIDSRFSGPLQLKEVIGVAVAKW